ncbi:MAG TPA: DUF3244 domain-containing protein [Dysgonomonas sp.]|uniref:DUF3244 domain-containing protein n=1 Tax=unclassified Dysgonomonas TaxID=2630389 RepID=UPI0025C6671A|nr:MULTISPECIES: DUF3244 domain-containing protein [unclassified Dysgonomonas]HML65283.1 DUF3244 domain-containing protein [Dysgonomonas sp.]
MKKNFIIILCILLCVPYSTYAIDSLVDETSQNSQKRSGHNKQNILLRAMLRMEVRTKVYQEPGSLLVVFDKFENPKQITITDRNNIICYDKTVDNIAGEEWLLDINFLTSGEYKLIIDIQSIGKCVGNFTIE